MVELEAMKNVQGLQALEILSEGFIDNLSVREAVEISLASNRLDSALFDVEGDTLGLAAGILGLFQDGLAALPPRDDLLQGRYQPDHHVLVARRGVVVGQRGPGGRLGTFLSGGRHGRISRVRVYT